MTENHITADDIKRIVHETLLESGSMTRGDVKQVVREAVQETLLTLGVDADNPLLVQQDMHFIRELRSASETIRSRGLLILVGILVTALAGATWLGIRASLGQP